MPSNSVWNESTSFIVHEICQIQQPVLDKVVISWNWILRLRLRTATALKHIIPAQLRNWNTNLKIPRKWISLYIVLLFYMLIHAWEYPLCTLSTGCSERRLIGYWLTWVMKTQNTIEASITLDSVTRADSLIRWSPNEWHLVCREIPVSADKMFWTSNKPAQWAFYIYTWKDVEFLVNKMWKHVLL
jgi:hypothetical protein